jgi:hypothetical protein
MDNIRYKLLTNWILLDKHLDKKTEYLDKKGYNRIHIRIIRIC